MFLFCISLKPTPSLSASMPINSSLIYPKTVFPLTQPAIFLKCLFGFSCTLVVPTSSYQTRRICHHRISGRSPIFLAPHSTIPSMESLHMFLSALQILHICTLSTRIVPNSRHFIPFHSILIHFSK